MVIEGWGRSWHGAGLPNPTLSPQAAANHGCQRERTEATLASAMARMIQSRQAGDSDGVTSVIAAVLILGVMVAVVLGLNPSREDFAWFLRLRRPRWLTFERLIPLIWLFIYGCFYASALVAWNSSGSLWLMAGYALLLMLVQSYTLVICRSRRLRPGTVVGFLGWLWGVALTLVVARWSIPAWLLLVPYLVWSPVGTFVTWQMQRLNRS